MALVAKAANPWKRKLNALAKALGFTHARLAEELGVSRITLRGWIYGKRQPLGPARKLIDIFCERHGIPK